MTPHGTYSGYKHHDCRCTPCETAHYRYRKGHRLGLTTPAVIDATGTRRRIQALYRMGWDATTLANQLGLGSPQAVSNMTRRTTITRANATRVAELYDHLGMTPGPSAKAREMAEARNLPGPLAWDDDRIDDPAATPDLGETEDGRTARARARLDDLEHLLDVAGPWTWDGITARLGVTRSAIEHACSPDRGNRPDLLARIRAGHNASREADHRGTAA